MAACSVGISPTTQAWSAPTAITSAKPPAIEIRPSARSWLCGARQIALRPRRQAEQVPHRLRSHRFTDLDHASGGLVARRGGIDRRLAGEQPAVEGAQAATAELDQQLVRAAGWPLRLAQLDLPGRADNRDLHASASHRSLKPRDPARSAIACTALAD